MIKITRQRLVGAALTAAFVVFISGGIHMLSYNPDWNHGGDPAAPHHPNSKVDGEFDPKYTMLLYMDIEDSDMAGENFVRIRAIRLQFKSVGWQQGNNTWETNKRKITDKINALNSSNTPPTESKPDLYVYPGLADFVFNQPHHVVIYIQNNNIDFDASHPIWFGNRLLEPGPGPKPEKARANWSFFAAKVETPMELDGTTPMITGPYSKKLIYMKNFFRGWGFFDGYYRIGTDRHSYALNINTLVKVTDTLGGGSASIPLIIDPDTGNMGGGEPTFVTK
jgi:hypothetical protein